MSGYLEFYRTGYKPFDDVLEMIEIAGSAYHHTSQWIEEGWDGEPPYLVKINTKIQEVERAIKLGRFCKLISDFEDVSK